MALGVDGPDATVAATLDHAARDAAVRGAPAVAAELLELALKLTPADETSETVRRKLDAASSHYNAGDIQRTRALVEPLFNELPPGPERARAALQLGWTMGDLVAAERLMEQALREGEGEPALLLGAHYFGWLLALVSRRLRRALEHARAAVELAEAGPDEGVLAQCLAALILTRTLAGEKVPETVVERALDLEARQPDMPAHYPPTLVCGQRAMFLGRFEDARALLDTAYQRIIERGDETMIGGVRWHQVDLAFRAGNWELAAAYSAEGLASAELLDSAREAVLLYAKALIDAHLGRTEDARAAAERGLELARESSSKIFAILSEWVLGFLELSLGNHAAAVDRLRPLPDRLALGGWLEPSICGALPDLIEALVALGELDEARAFLDRLDEQAETSGSLWARAVAGRSRALVATAEGNYPSALAALEQALEEHAQLPEPFQRARTLLVYGSTLRRAKHRRRARELLESALAIFEELGATLWAERARVELARIGGRTPSAGQLTPIEERIAALVAEGRTNREVGAALNLSARTVEGHLSHVYAKLGVHSRLELAHQQHASRL